MRMREGTCTYLSLPNLEFAAEWKSPGSGNKPANRARQGTLGGEDQGEEDPHRTSVNLDSLARLCVEKVRKVCVLCNKVFFWIRMPQ